MKSFVIVDLTFEMFSFLERVSVNMNMNISTSHNSFWLGKIISENWWRQDKNGGEALYFEIKLKDFHCSWRASAFITLNKELLICVIHPLNSKLLIALALTQNSSLLALWQWPSLSFIICWGWFNWKSSRLLLLCSDASSASLSSRFSPFSPDRREEKTVVRIFIIVRQHSSFSTLNRIILFH